MASSADRVPTSRVPTIIVHGGAGADLSRAPEFRQGVRSAVLAGWRVLEAGGTALDAVEGAVRTLEDDPRFNAGHGSVLNRDGRIERIWRGNAWTPAEVTEAIKAQTK